MHVSHMFRSALKVLHEQGPRPLVRLSLERFGDLKRGVQALSGGVAGRRYFLSRTLNNRLEFEDVTLPESDVASCDPIVMRLYCLRRFTDVANYALLRAKHLDPLALLLLCDTLYRLWRYKELAHLSSVVRDRTVHSSYMGRLDNLLRRAAAGCGMLSDAVRGLAPIENGTLADCLLRGDVWNAAGQMELATEAYQQAIRRQSDNPMARLHYGFHLLKKGEFKDGLSCWGLAERIFGYFPLQADEPLWRGEDLNGKSLLVVFEHGFGDMIQFARYLAQLMRCFPRAAVTGLVPAPILGLMAQSFPQVEFITKRSTVQIDFHIPSTQLPLVLDAEVYEPQTYIRLTRSGSSPGHDRIEPPGPFRVGVCWRGHPRQYEQSRSVDLKDLSELFATSGARFTVLLNNLTDAERSFLEGFSNVSLPLIGDFSDLAAVIDGCDLIVSVDTSIVHLAGAAGKPVVLLCRPDSCWRWGAAGTTSPWYPDIRVVRHPHDLDWADVLRKTQVILEQAIEGSVQDSRPALRIAG